MLDHLPRPLRNVLSATTSRRSVGNRDAGRFRIDLLEDRTVPTAYSVTSLADNIIADGQVTLREALQAANTNAPVGDALAGGATDSIDFATVGTVTLNPAFGEFLVSDQVSIDGNGSILDANGQSRIFSIDTASNTPAVELESLILRNGTGAGAAVNGNGGAIYIGDDSVVTLTELQFRSNTANADGAGATFGDGGAIASSGELTVVGTFFEANTAARAGGAIEVIGGTATIFDSAFLNNTAAVNGGALHVSDGTTNATRGAVVGNVAQQEGGGFWNSDSGLMTVDGTDFFSNFANGNNGDDADTTQGGGGLFNLGSLNLANAFFRNNAAQFAGNNGGGLMNSGDSAFATVANSRFTDNAAARAGGGIENTGVLDLIDAAMLNNAAGVNGGGVHGASAADTEVVRGAFVGNVATQEGGGLWNAADSAMTVTGTQLVANHGDAMDGDPNDVSQGGGGIFNLGSLVVSGALFRDNFSDTAGGNGGGLMNSGAAADANVSGSTFVSNRAARAGGGIENTGTLDLNDTAFLNNRAGVNGGAVHNASAGADVEVNRGAMVGNRADNQGGGLWVGAGSSGTVRAVSIASNSAPQGGGLYLQENGSLFVLQSLLNNNTASGLGGGLAIGPGAAGAVDVVNSTFTSNGAPVGSQIYLNTGTLRIGNSTIVRGETTGGGTGAAVHNQAGTLQSMNTIYAYSTGGADTGGPTAFTSQGYNFVQTDAGAFGGGGGGDQFGVDPMLATVANNAGPTATIRPRNGSPVVDAGRNSPLSGTFDQRGLPRPVDQVLIGNAAGGDGTDVGAFERQ